MKKVILALVVFGSFPLIQADENAELEAQRREHVRKLYHAVATGDQICIDRIMKGSSDSPALQLKTMLEQLDVDGRKKEKTMIYFFQRSMACAAGAIIMQGLVKYLNSTLSSESGASRAAGR